MIMQCTPFRQRQGPAGEFLVNTFHFIDTHAAEMVEIFNEGILIRLIENKMAQKKTRKHNTKISP